MRVKEYRNIGEKVYTEKLYNNLKIIVIPKPGYSKTYAFFATNYGSADRRFKMDGNWQDTPAGVAHFLEHKMFDMEDGNALTELSANGASPNAFTSSNITAYYFECTDKFEENLEILLKFVSTSYFTEESVSKEQGIIGQEIRMTEDEPEFAVYYGLMNALFQWNPVREPVAGTIESIAEINTDILYACHKVFYNPSNMVLCVTGNVDPEKVSKITKRTLSGQAGGEPERDYGQEESQIPVCTKTETFMEVGMPLFLVGAKVDGKLSGKEAMRQALIAELSLSVLMGSSSTLYAELYENGLINTGFSADYETSSDIAYVLCGGESRDPDMVRAKIEAAALKLAADGPDPQLFSRLKKSAFGKKIRELNSFENICYNMACGYFKGYDYYEMTEVLEQITSEDVRKFVAETLTPEKLALSVVRKK